MEKWHNFLLNVKVYRIWRSNPPKACPGFGICSCSIYNKRRVLC